MSFCDVRAQCAEAGVSAPSSSTLFEDFQSLQGIWTHPSVLKDKMMANVEYSSDDDKSDDDSDDKEHDDDDGDKSYDDSDDNEHNDGEDMQMASSSNSDSKLEENSK